jgi:thioredoxin 1
MAEPLTVTDATFQAEVLDSSIPVLVDFWATWCSPCKMIAPIVEELAGEYEGRVKVAKVDVDANPVIPGQFGVMSIPTLLVFVAGLGAHGSRWAPPSSKRLGGAHAASPEGSFPSRSRRRRGILRTWRNRRGALPFSLARRGVPRSRMASLHTAVPPVEMALSPRPVW